MIPEAAMMKRLALAVEENAHTLGWDSVPPLLGLVVYVDDGWISAPAPVQPVDIADDLGEALQSMASSMRKARLAGAKLGELARLGALWMVCEGWANEDVGRIFRSKKGRRVECRQVLLMDLSGRLTQALRVRGQKPWVAQMMAKPVPTSPEIGGVLVGMRDLLLEHAVEMDEGEANLVALASWRSS